MKNRSIWMGLCLLALAALIVPLAASGQKVSKTAPTEMKLDELEKMQEKLARELGRVERLLESKLVGIEERIPSLRAEQMRALENLKLGEFNFDEIRERARAAELAAREVGAVNLEGVQERVREAEVFARAAAEAAVQGASVWVGGSERGWLGVSVDDITSEKAKELKLTTERGVLVDDVDADSPAAKAGLKKGDVITHFGGQTVEGVVQFRRYVSETPAGRVVQLTVWRDGRAQQISATICDFGDQLRERVRNRVTTVVPRNDWHRFGENFSYNFRMPDVQVFSSAAARPMLGIRTEDLDGQLGAYFGAPNNEGVLVTHVNTGSPAEKAGLKAGDVIVKVDGGQVRDTSDLRERMRDAREKKTVPVAVIRKGAETTINVEIEQPKPTERARVTRRVNL